MKGNNRKLFTVLEEPRGECVRTELLLKDIERTKLKNKKTQQISNINTHFHAGGIRYLLTIRETIGKIHASFFRL